MQSTTVRTLSQRSSIVKTLFLVLAAITLFVTTAVPPSFADGNPWPICTEQGCKKPMQ